MTTTAQGTQITFKAHVQIFVNDGKGGKTGKMVRVPQDGPAYMLTEAFFDPHNIWHPAGTPLKFDGIPNASMIPLNEHALKKYDAYMDGLDAGLKLVCEKNQPPLHFVAHERIYEVVEEDEFVDVSKQPAGMQEQTTGHTLRLGATKPRGAGAQALT